MVVSTLRIELRLNPASCNIRETVTPAERFAKVAENEAFRCDVEQVERVREEIAFFQTVKVLLTKKEISTKKQVDDWIKTYGVRYFGELTNMAILTEEVGELARVISRTYGEQSFKNSDKEANLADEMADVLWVLICMANQTGVDLTEAFDFAKGDRRRYPCSSYY